MQSLLFIVVCFLSYFFSDVVHTVDCSHNRALYLFTESIVNSCQFSGYPCSTKEKFDQGACSKCGPGGCPSMGYPAKPNQAPPGRYYLKTGPHEPFCRKNFMVAYSCVNYRRCSGSGTPEQHVVLN